MRFRSTFVAAAGVLAASVNACCVAMPANTHVQLSSEDVIIVWDKAHGVEHFIRKAQFTSDQKDFGFIVPTPSMPTLSKVDEGAYDDLKQLIPPPSPKGMGCAISGDTGAMTMATRAVTVLAEQQVGSYLATIVKATDGRSLAEWLAKNGFAQRPAMTEWLDFYAKQSWIFTALKYNMPNKPANPEEQYTEAIRLSFKTDQPHYPYKMPTDTWPSGYHRPMRVYFVSSSPVQAKYEGSGKYWEADNTFTGRIDDNILHTVAYALNLANSDMPEHATLTVFDNGDNPDGYGEDLIFEPTRSWLWAYEAGLVLVVVYGVVYFRRRSRKTPPVEQKMAA